MYLPVKLLRLDTQLAAVFINERARVKNTRYPAVAQPHLCCVPLP